MRFTATPISGVIPSTPIAWTTSHLFFVATGRVLRSYAVDPASFAHNHVAVLRGHTAAVTTVISLPGMRIASASEDGTMRIWDVTTGQTIRIFDFANPILHIAYVPSEQLLCVTSNSLLHVHLTRNRSKRRRQLVRKLFSEALSQPARVVLSTDATVVAISDATNIHLTGLAPEAARTTLRCRRVITALAITKDGNILAAADESGIISLYFNPRELLGAKCLFIPFEKAAPTQLHWHAAALQALAFAHDDSVLLSAGSEAVLVTWRLSPALFGTRTFLPRLRSAIRAVSISPDERIYAISQADNAVRLIDQLSSGVVQTIRAVPTRLLDFSDRNPKALLSSRVNPQYIKTCSTFPDPEQHGMLWVTGAGSSLQLFNVFSGSNVDEIQVIPRNAVFEGSHVNNTKGLISATVSDVAVHLSGHFLATIDSQDICTLQSQRYGTDTEMHTLKFWRRESADQSFVLDAVISQPHGSDCSVSSLCFHPKLPLLATTSRESRTFKLWRATRNSRESCTGWRSEIELDYKGMDCNGVCFSSDGSLIVVACGHILTLWQMEDRLSAGLDEADKFNRTITSDYSSQASFRSVSVQFLHALVHPPSEEQIISVTFVFKSVPLIIAVTPNGIYVWHALSQSIWWSTRIRSDSRKLAVDPDSGRFALQLVIPSVGNDEEEDEGEPINQRSALSMNNKQPAEGARTSPRKRNNEKKANSEPNVPVSVSLNGAPSRSVKSNLQFRASSKSNRQACTDAAVAVYDASSPVPLHIHRLATGSKVAALSFVRQPGERNQRLSTLVCLDSRMEVFLYGAEDNTTIPSSSVPSDVIGLSKLKPVGNLERILGKGRRDHDLYGTSQSREDLASQSSGIIRSNVDEAFRMHFHGLTHVQAPAATNSFEFIKTLVMSHQEGQRLHPEVLLPANMRELIETGDYSHGNRRGLRNSSRVFMNKTMEVPCDPDCSAIRSFCVSAIRKSNAK